MHFFYLDESGCTGKDLTAAQQPIFVSGGIVVRDGGWNRTHEDFQKIIGEYFGNQIPDNFELHTKELFSPNGDGFFKNNKREDRNKLITKLLDLIIERKHQIFFFAIDKKKLKEYNIDNITTKTYFDLKLPYSIAYDYLISVVNNYVKEKLGSSARALMILDENGEMKDQIKSITEYRRYKCQKKDIVKWITEYSYLVDSGKNTMVQLSDFVIYIIRKFLEIENGYKNTMGKELHSIYRDFYIKIDNKIIGRKIYEDTGRNSNHYNDFIKQITVSPSKGWKKKIY